MATITEDYVSFEIAKLLKEKGFDVPCLAHWFIGSETHEKFSDYPFNWNEIKSDLDWLSRPTHQMAMKWLRKNYQIFIRPNISFLYPIKWYSEIFCYGDNLKTQQDIKIEYYNSPEEACEAAIKYCLKNLI